MSEKGVGRDGFFTGMPRELEKADHSRFAPPCRKRASMRAAASRELTYCVGIRRKGRPMHAICKRTAPSLAFAMAILPAAGSAAATYDAALKNAMAKADVKACDAIDKPVFEQDYGISVEQAQDMCRVEVAAAQGKTEACMALDNKRRHPAEETVRHRCLARMAQLFKRADICALIPPEEESTEETMQRARCNTLARFSARDCRQFDSDQQAQLRLFRDNCRLQTISDPGQSTHAPKDR